MQKATRDDRAAYRSQLEDLLGPTLSLIANLGPIRATDIASMLHRKGLLPAESSEDAQDVVHGTGRIVLGASQELKNAELIKWESPRVFSATRAGHRLARSGRRVTFEELRKRPKYVHHQRRIADKVRRQAWQHRRFDHYVAGRLLASEGSFYAAPTVFAYAIEYSLKAAINELPDGAPERRVLRARESRHNLNGLYGVCCDKGLLEGVDISADFLVYAEEHFGRRYPSGERDLLDKRGRIVFGGDIRAVYDDVMIQLERGLDALYGEGTWSLGSRALTDSFAGLAKAFFHDNVFAVNRLAEYRAALEGKRITYPEPEHLDRPDMLFACDSERMGYPGVTYEKAREVLHANLASSFVYPQEPQDPDWL